MVIYLTWTQISMILACLLQELMWGNLFFSFRFDKRITEFAEKKFNREGIDVRTGSMVVKVSNKEISTKERSGEVSSIPYGMAVWSTGIGTRPVVRDFMQQIGQVCYFST